MTRKDFESIAALIRARADDFKSNTAHARFAGRMASELRWTNSNFDRERFVMAAMPTWMVGTAKANAWEREARRGTDNLVRDAWVEVRS